MPSSSLLQQDPSSQEKRRERYIAAALEATSVGNFALEGLSSEWADFGRLRRLSGSHAVTQTNSVFTATRQRARMLSIVQCSH